MDDLDIKRRIQDLIIKSEKTGKPVPSTFFTPAEKILLAKYYKNLHFIGGYVDAERCISLVLPEWYEEDDIVITDYLSCVRIQSYFGVPSHRDYMGAVLGLGISRDRIGDIIVDGDCAYLICLKSVKKTIISELDKVGRISVKVKEADFSELSNIKKDVRKITFTVKSLRLDAIIGEMFFISRTKAAEAIKEGYISLNYTVVYKCDVTVNENDIISFHGKGKGKISKFGGKSRRDRQYVTADIYI